MLTKVKGKVFLKICPGKASDPHDQTGSVALVVYSYEINHMWIMSRNDRNPSRCSQMSFHNTVGRKKKKSENAKFTSVYS